MAINLPHVITFRLDDVAKAALDRAADAYGLAAPIYVRHIVLKALDVVDRAPRVRRRVMHAEELRALLAELARQGSNLNQLARHVNAGGRAHEIRDVVEQLRREHDRALQTVTNLLVGGVR